MVVNSALQCLRLTALFALVCELAAAGEPEYMRLPPAIGLGIEDIAIGKAILHEAEKRQLGQLLPLWEQPFAI